MKKAKLVFIPCPGIGHLASIFEIAKHLRDRDDRFSISVLIIKIPVFPYIETYAQSLFSSDTRIEYITLPDVLLPSDVDPAKSFLNFLTVLIDCHRSHVKHTILNQVITSNNSVPLAALVVDSICSSMIDVGKELGVPSYVFFASGDAFLGLNLYLQIRHDQVANKEFEETDSDYNIPSYVNPVPSRVLPSVLFNKNGDYTSAVNISRNMRAAKGIIVNSFIELESHAINSFKVFDDVPPVYNIGPLLDLKGNLLLGQELSNRGKRDQIISWLDTQVPESVVFLCFGSIGTFSEPQLQEIAIALERSGHRFLWSVRRSPPQDKFEWPGEYTNYGFLPEGFLDRTKNVGLICGWVPQVEVLAHRAIGAFVSHCGWNSILESLWHGVPVVTWPLYSEQQINAFQMVKDLGLAVEMKLDYNVNNNISSGIVGADEIEKPLKCVMNQNCEVRNKVKAMSEWCRQALMEGGSSYAQFGSLVEDILSADKGLKTYHYL